MANEIEIQERVLRHLLVQLNRTQSVFDPASDDYATLQGGIDQTAARLNELRAAQGLDPINLGKEVSPLVDVPVSPNP